VRIVRVRIVFCGNPEFAIPSLNALLASRHEVAAVVTGPDKPQGRGRRLKAMPVKERAQEAGIEVLQPESLSDAGFLKGVRTLAAEALVVVAFRILPRELFALPRYGSFNVHPSLLPKGRGPAPIRWTLMRGETETGVTIIHLSEVIDGGEILAQERTAVGTDEDFGSLHDRLAEMGARCLTDVLDRVESGSAPPPIRQDEAQVTRAPKLRNSDFRLDWTMSARDLGCRIRAFSPQPGAVTRLNGRVFKILAADEMREKIGLACGELRKTGEDGLAVGTGDGALQLKVVQPEGKRAMSVAEFLRGRPALPERFE
jgi:methionyl-tRNA formyltransferase